MGSFILPLNLVLLLTKFFESNFTLEQNFKRTKLYGSVHFCSTIFFLFGLSPSNVSETLKSVPKTPDSVH